MPIECGVEISPVGQEPFHAVDRTVMKHAFDIHNTLGRFCDERVYQDELAHRCRADGLEVHREVLLRVSHAGFSKPYFLDMLVGRGVIYELKATERLAPVHQTQLINYLLLAGLSHGKLVNFRPGSVESRFVSTRLGHGDRTALHVEAHAWLEDDKPGPRLRAILSDLLADWGAFLDVGLYRDALLHFTTGPAAATQPVDIHVNGRLVGTQQMCMLGDDTAWHLSAIRQPLDRYETHLVRLLRHTRLKRMHWINLDQRTVTLRTLTQ